MSEDRPEPSRDRDSHGLSASVSAARVANLPATAGLV